MPSAIVRNAAFALAVFAVAGCGGNPPALTSVAAPKAGLAKSQLVTVRIENYAYFPKTIAVKAGTTIKFANRDSITHTVTAKNGSFSSPLLAPGRSWKHTFETPGKYKYYCKIHPFMHGVVKVTK